MFSKIFAGVDVGGTNIKIGLVDENAQTRAFESIPTRQADGPEAAMRRVAQTIDQLCGQAQCARADIAGIGLATPGPLNLVEGTLLIPGNLPAWHHTPIVKLLTDTAGQRVTFANDANAAAYGEFWSGAGARYHSMVLLTLGTGVGGGVIVNDRLIEGAHGCGGEIGHIVIDSADDAPLNSLDLRGTLEGYCGSYGVTGRAKAALADRFVQSSLRDSVAEGEQLTPLLIANAAEAGDEVAMRVVMDTARYLAIGIATCVHLVDPESVVIGGGMNFGGAGSPLGEKFIEEVRTQAKKRFFSVLRDQIHIDFAQLGGDAGYIGAAGLASSRAGDN